MDINLRVSTLSGWNDCPRRSSTRVVYDLIKAAGYILNPAVMGVGAAIGTGVHAGTAHIMKEKKETRIARLMDAQEIGITKYREESASGAEFDQKTDSNNTAETQIKNITGAYYHGVAPHIEPVEIERAYDAPVKPGFTLSGHPDLITRTSIRDLKTSKGGQTYQAQLGGYALLRGANSEIEPETLIIDWIPRVSIKKPQPEPISYEYPAELCRREAQAVIAQVQWQVIQFQRLLESAEKFAPAAFPVNPSSMLCSRKYCTAYGTDYCPISKTFKE